MASETYFQDGEKVRFSKNWIKDDPHKEELAKLVGTVIECDDSARECCYYDVRWDNLTKEQAQALEMDPHEDFDEVVKSYQSDALAKYHPPSTSSKSKKKFLSFQIWKDDQQVYILSKEDVTKNKKYLKDQKANLIFEIKAESLNQVKTMIEKYFEVK